jgi:hypothetical protein
MSQLKGGISQYIYNVSCLPWLDRAPKYVYVSPNISDEDTHAGNHRSLTSLNCIITFVCPDNLPTFPFQRKEMTTAIIGYK